MVCKMTHKIARELLFKHCLYLDRSRKLDQAVKISRLRRLALYNPHMGEGYKENFVDEVQDCPSLRHLVITNTEDVEEVSFPHEMKWRGLERVTFVDAEHEDWWGEMCEKQNTLPGWERTFVGELMTSCYGFGVENGLRQMVFVGIPNGADDEYQLAREHLGSND
ncbi:hypothetical protein BDV06DRAFT_220110 [Aspergillus oleicola]